MRKVTGFQSFVFFSLFAVIIALSIFSAHFMCSLVSLGSYHAVSVVFLSSFLIVLYSLFSYRLCLLIFPIKAGEIKMHSKEEFSYHLHLLFHLFVFHPLIRSKILPVPISKLMCLIMGAKMGSNSFSSGYLLDPFMVEIGDNTLLGLDSMLIPHVIENEKLAHYPIKIGSNVTVGAGAVVLPDTTIEDDAIVSASALIKKGTYIKRGEIWGGVPAKLISVRKDLANGKQVNLKEVSI